MNELMKEGKDSEADLEEGESSDIKVENRVDEFQLLESVDSYIESDNKEIKLLRVTITRLGYFPSTRHYQKLSKSESRKWFQPFYFDSEEIVEKLSIEYFYRDSYFEENIIEEILLVKTMREKIKYWDDADQYQLYREAIDWFGFFGSEINKLYFKQEQMSIQ